MTGIRFMADEKRHRTDGSLTNFVDNDKGDTE
jgi:hypothetical protein